MLFSFQTVSEFCRKFAAVVLEKRAPTPTRSLSATAVALLSTRAVTASGQESFWQKRAAWPALFRQPAPSPGFVNPAELGFLVPRGNYYFKISMTCLKQVLLMQDSHVTLNSSEDVKTPINANP